jgi:hypothetical protein
MRNGSAYIIDRSTNGTYVNLQRIRKNSPVALHFGDSIRIFRLNIVYLGSMIAVHAREGFTVHRQQLSAEQIDQLSAEPGKKKDAGVVEFHRAPRIMPVLFTEPVEIEAPPNRQEIPKMPLFMRIGPSFTMALPMLITAFMSIVLANTNGTGRSAFMYTGIIMALTSASVGVFWAIKNMRYQERMHAENEENRVRRYGNYLEDIKRYLDRCYHENQKKLNTYYISADRCCELDESYLDFAAELVDATEDVDMLVAALLHVGFGNRFMEKAYPVIRTKRREFRDRDNREGRGEKKNRKAPEHRDDYVKLLFTKGKNDGITPQVLLEMIFNAVRITSKRLGKISCFPKNAIIEVPASLASKIVSGVNGHTHSNLMRYVDEEKNRKNGKKNFEKR